MNFHVPKTGDKEFPTSVKNSAAVGMCDAALLYLFYAVAADNNGHILLRRTAARIDNRYVRYDQRRIRVLSHGAACHTLKHHAHQQRNKQDRSPVTPAK